MEASVKRAVTFDDVLIVPRYSEIESRDDVDISTEFGQIKLDIPIISAPMDSVTEHLLASEMIKAGAGAIIHRYNSIEEQTNEVLLSIKNKNPENYLIGITVGVKDIESQVNRISFCLEKLTRLRYRSLEIDNIEKHFMITIDIAHGDHKKLYLLSEKIKNKFPKMTLCAGNICTPSAAQNYKNSGIDVAKIGVGPGCFVSGTLVLTISGFKEINEIKIGDYVLTHKFRFMKVQNTTKRKENECTINVNNTIRCTKEHKFYVVNRKYKDVVNEKNIDSIAEWIEAKDLTNEYFLVKSVQIPPVPNTYLYEGTEKDKMSTL